jgi:hypothetical protein
MSTIELFKAIEKLPADKKKEVENLVAELLSDTDNAVEPAGKHVFDRGYGSLKGKIWMSDDFDEPLEEFKDYI